MVSVFMPWRLAGPAGRHQISASPVTALESCRRCAAPAITSSPRPDRGQALQRRSSGAPAQAGMVKGGRDALNGGNDPVIRNKLAVLACTVLSTDRKSVV